MLHGQMSLVTNQGWFHKLEMICTVLSEGGWESLKVMTPVLIFIVFHLFTRSLYEMEQITQETKLT